MRPARLVPMTAAALCVLGMRATADTVDPSAGNSAAAAVVQPAGQADTAVNATATEAGEARPAAAAAVPPAGQMGATESGQRGKRKVYVAVSYSAFMPTSGETRRDFGDVWSGFGIGLFRPEQPRKLAFDWNLSVRSKHGRSDALLIPMTVGVLRGLGQNPHQQPYAAVRVGAYYGKVDDNLEGPDDTRIGACANVAVGLIIDRKYQLEARYDWFTRLAGNNFDGLTLTAGIKVAEFSR